MAGAGRRLFPTLAILGLAGCAVPPAAPPPALREARFAELPGWDSDPLAEAMPALALQCARMAALPAGTPLGGDGLPRATGGQAGDWSAACAARPPAPDDATARRYFEAWFQPYRVDRPGLVTGYFEPLVRGSFRRSAEYDVPVLARPDDLVETAAADPASPPVIGQRTASGIVPYPARAEIEAGHTEARPLLYLASVTDLFFLQIQGSGRVLLPEGGTVRLAFAGSNGRPYTPIGRLLVEQHALAPADVSMASIRAWLDAHPAEGRALMDRNAHYVFFRVAGTDAAAGPPGTLGVPLTPGRSAAVDRAAIPLGTPLFLDTRDPISGGVWRHLAFAQDTGADLHGLARADLFLGSGFAAERMAGAMHETGTAWLLLPRPGGSRVATMRAKSELAGITP